MLEEKFKLIIKVIIKLIGSTMVLSIDYLNAVCILLIINGSQFFLIANIVQCY